MSIGGTVAKIRAITFIFHLLNWDYGIRRSIFRILEVILIRLEFMVAKIRAKHLFASFVIAITTIGVQFLEHWRLCCID